MESAFLAGQLLISMPGISDPRFERTVILMCAHDAEHAMGVAVNRPVEGLTVPDLLTRLEIPVSADVTPDLVRLGGPVEVERGFVLHTDDYRGPHTLDVEGGYALTTTREVLVEMAAGSRTPRRATLALGYSGWGAGQLEQEIRQNVWLTVAPDEDLVFDDDFDTKWFRALGKLGIDAKFLGAEAGRA